MPPSARSSSGRRAALVGGLVLVASSLVVALVALRHPRWHPLFELAMTELKVRDVGSRHPPLVGLPGRIGTPPDVGRHPGPLAYWFMWPVYRLFGASSWALQVASVWVHLSAAAAALWLAARRAGAAGVVVTTAALLVLVHAYGPTALTDAWNPHLPLLWWVAFLLALWSFLCGDRWALPVAVFAGSLAVQTHIPYAVAVLGTTGLTLAGAVVARTARRRRGGSDHPGETGRRRAPLAVAVIAATLVWLPPLVEQLTTSPGNLTRIVRHFRDAPSAVVGPAEGVRLVLHRLDPVALLTGSFDVGGLTPATSVAPGAVLLAAWAVAAALAWRSGHGALLRLHGVLLAAGLTAVVAGSRIFGPTWNYLLLWTWGVTALVAAAVLSTCAAVLVDRLPAERASTARRVSIALGAGVAATVAAFAVADATDAGFDDRVRSQQVGRVAPATATALDAATARSRSREVLLTWSDPTYLPLQGYGLLLELERRGWSVGVLPAHAATVGRHRVVDAAEAELALHLAVGPDIAGWRARPNAREIAFTDRPADLRAERSALVADVRAGLEREGLHDLARLWRHQPAAAALDPGFPESLRPAVTRIEAIAHPVAVFLIEEPDAS